ncbi:hypothetical protein EYM_01615 [Ignicoccus islandicus DSM 13165]|uniref:Uncharacterized protein n=1 Tax=Ignicoccus islandicus DSM 13165 TaxID=940295 RepID=A0A0U3F1R2_9CREN|nr:hypothetical protein [Ignicoccus islandicus]ALU11493.1 hypothetical protein EYM_01615 [Ignicoccus islandicus DSM 13165]
MKSITVILLTFILANAFELKLMWSFDEPSDRIEDMVFSSKGNLGIASWDNCAYVVDLNGHQLGKTCGTWDMDGAGYFNGLFGFVNLDNYVYLINNNGTFWKKIYVGDYHHTAIALLNNGFVACDSYCARFNLNGEKLWDTYVGAYVEDVAIRKGYIYAANSGSQKLQVIDLNTGKVVSEIKYERRPGSVSVCNDYLAVIAGELYFYDISDPRNPKLIWKSTGLNVDDNEHSPAFSPNCKYVAVADNYWFITSIGNSELKIFDVNGDLIYSKYLPGITSVAWWNDVIAVGYLSGKVELYRVINYTSPIARYSEIEKMNGAGTLVIQIKPLYVYQDEFSKVPIIGRLLVAGLVKALYGKLSLDSLYVSVKAYLETINLAKSYYIQAEKFFKNGDFVNSLEKLKVAKALLHTINTTYSNLKASWERIETQMRSLEERIVPVREILVNACGTDIGVDWNSSIAIEKLKECSTSIEKILNLIEALKRYKGWEGFSASLVLRDLTEFGNTIKEMYPRVEDLSNRIIELETKAKLVLESN